MNVRVYMLAKELELGNKTIMDQLERMGCKVANHMSLVSDDVVKGIRKFYADDANWTAAQTAEQAERETIKKPRPKRRKAPRKPAVKKAAPAKKKAAEPAAAQAEPTAAAKPAAPVVTEQMPAQPPAEEEKPAAAEQPVPAPEAPPAAAKAREHPLEAAGERGRAGTPEAEEDVEIKKRRKPKRGAVRLGRIDLRAPSMQPGRERPTRPSHPAHPTRPSHPAHPARPAHPSRAQRPAAKIVEAPEPAAFTGHDRKQERRFIKTFPRQKVVSRQKIPFLKERVPLGRGRQDLHKKSRETAVLPVVVPDRFEIDMPVTVKDLAAKLAVKTGDIIKRMMMNNMMIRINDYLDEEIIELIGAEYGKEINIKKVRDVEDALDEYMGESKPEELEARPPVITFLGHVDHGKTSLLDRIRQTSVAKGEAGGITQHIGAHVVRKDGRRLVFLDTPGHEAFTEMRARGANVTDIVVLVVAADDGVMPQTSEAISHARAAEVPIVVALNKIDKPNANILKTKQQLATAGLNPVEWGGQTECVEVSAITGQGVDNLLEVLTLQADVMELKGNPHTNARGSVLDAKLTDEHGIVATMLVTDGMLRDGDIIVAGGAYGKVRNMKDDKGKTVHQAGPATPVAVTGLSEVPKAGDAFVVIDDLQKARQVAITRTRRYRQSDLIKRGAGGHVTLENLFDRIAQGHVKELPVILKADVQGSIEAIQKSLNELGTSEVRIKFLHSAVGGINESDVMLADASDAIIIGFQVVPDTKARRLAEEKRVDTRIFHIIYELIDTVKAAMSGMLEPEEKETVIGSVTVKQSIKISRVGTVAGCQVIDGKIERNANARLIRGGVIVHEGRIETLRRFKDDVREVEKGYECGIKLAAFDDVKEGDVIEAYKIEKIKREL